MSKVRAAGLVAGLVVFLVAGDRIGMAGAPPFAWTPFTPLVSGRAAMGLTVGLDMRLYAMGGSNGSLLSSVETLDPRTAVWASAPSLSVPRLGLSGAADRENRIYAIGGLEMSAIVSTVERLDSATAQWIRVAPLITPREAAAAATGKDGRIFVIGGISSLHPLTFERSVEAFNPIDGTWSTVAPMPTARGQLAATTGTDGRIYAVGGVTAQGATDAVEAYDPQSNSWQSLAPLPVPRASLGAATATDGRIFAIGGLIGSVASNRVDALDPTTGMWNSAPPLIRARYALGAADADGRIYAVGGAANAQEPPLKEVEGLTLTSPTAAATATIGRTLTPPPPSPSPITSTPQITVIPSLIPAVSLTVRSAGTFLCHATKCGPRRAFVTQQVVTFLVQVAAENAGVAEVSGTVRVMKAHSTLRLLHLRLRQGNQFIARTTFTGGKGIGQLVAYVHVHAGDAEARTDVHFHISKSSFR